MKIAYGQFRISGPQLNYIEILLDRLGIRFWKMNHMPIVVGRQVHFLHELTKEEAHTVIDFLKKELGDTD